MTRVTFDAQQFLFGNATVAIGNLPIDELIQLLTTASEKIPVAGYVCELQSLKQILLGFRHVGEEIKTQTLANQRTQPLHIDANKYTRLATIQPLELEFLLKSENGAEGEEHIAVLERQDSIATPLGVRIIRIKWRLKKKYDDSRTVPTPNHTIEAYEVGVSASSFKEILESLEPARAQEFTKQVVYRLYEVMSATKNYFASKVKACSDTERILGALLRRLQIL